MSDEIDDQLRSRFQEAFPTSAQSTQSAQASQSAQVLTDLGPAMGRARFRRRAGAIGSSAVGILLIGGAILGTQAGPSRPTNVVVAGPGPGGDSVNSTSLTSTMPDGSDSRPGMTFDDTTGSTLTGSTATSSGSVTTLDTGGTTSETLGTNNPSDGSESTTTAPAPTTAGAPTTEAGGSGSTTTSTDGSGPTTSLPASDSEETVVSECGSVVVGISGSEVSVVSVNPMAGHSYDVHNSGPEKVEVSFENGSSHCEIEAHVAGGELVTEVENED